MGMDRGYSLDLMRYISITCNMLSINGPSNSGEGHEKWVVRSGLLPITILGRMFSESQGQGA